MEKFISSLKEKHSSQNKFIDEIASILDIKYDAAYRRITGIAKFSLEEALVLAKKYQISLDNLIESNEEELFLLKKDHSLKNIDAIGDYLEQAYQTLLPFFKQGKTNVIYSSKDIPIFYTLGDSILDRFKMYCWCWMLDAKFSTLQLSFSDFSLPKKLIDSGNKLAKAYQQLPIIEFWNETILQSTFYQINYFLELELLSKPDAERIFQELHQFLHNTEHKLQFDDSNIEKPNYDIYVNELILMNNSILFFNPKQKTMLIPLTIMGFIELQNENILKEQIRFYELQKQNSVLLSGGNQKTRSLFFKKLHTKIDIFKMENLK